MNEHLETADALLQGAIDLHMHTAPDIYPRSVTTLEAAVQARDAGMRAILVKSHSTDTAARAEIVSDLTGFTVLGAISLNYSVGGINPYAVLESVRQGGRLVWLPTTSARHFLERADNAPILREKSPLDLPGLVATEDGELLPETEQVLELVGEHDLILASGHLSPQETIQVFRRAREIGIERLVVTHPHADFIGASIEEMRVLADLGAVHEMHYAFTTKAIDPPQRLSDIAAQIRAVGVDRCFMATDGGQHVNPPPLEMLRAYVAGFLELGFSEQELRSMTSDTPARLLGIAGDDAAATAERRQGAVT